jgi:uncharacterized protein
VISLRDFFERAREGELTGITCGGCGALAIPPREFCAECHQRAWRPTRLSGDGTIVSYTVIRVAPRAHAAQAPYAIVAVLLKEGVSLLGRIVDIPIEKVVIGLPVRFRPFITHGETAVGFGPA